MAPEKFKCVTCEKSFTRKLNLASCLNIHAKIHHCIFCNKTLSNVYKLIQHYQSHINEKPSFCDLCGDAFSTEFGLTSHIQIHTCEQAFVCQKSFSQHRYLKKHNLRQTEFKTFKCYKCKKTFFDRCNFQNYVNTHKTEMPCKCNQCNQFLASNVALTSHIKTHTGETPCRCAFCSKSFARKSS